MMKEALWGPEVPGVIDPDEDKWTEPVSPKGKKNGGGGGLQWMVGVLTHSLNGDLRG